MSVMSNTKLYQDKKTGKRVKIVGGTSLKEDSVLVCGNDRLPYYTYLSQLVECDERGTPNFEVTADQDRPPEKEEKAPEPLVALIETRLNLNMATPEEIERRVPGVGYRIAKRIVEQRMTLPAEKFVSLDQVRSVSNRVNWDEVEKANVIFLG
jgi:DNA uptake protein ComE-like DNA-binding protein